MKAGWGRLALSVAAGALYLGTLSHNLGAAHDSIAYLNQIESGGHPFHPHHLLYGPAASMWLSAIRALGWESDAAQGVAALSAVAGVVTLALFHSTLLRMGRSPTQALLGSALPALSFGFWFYSVSVEVYLLPLPFLMGAFLLLLDTPTAGRFLAVGVLHGSAMLMHQSHALFGTLVLMALRGSPAGVTRRAFAAYAASAGGLALGGYAGVLLFSEQVRALESPLAFLIGYAGDAGFWEPLSLATLPRMAIGAGRALIGAHFVFAIPALRERIGGALPDQYLEDELFLVGELGRAPAVALLAASVLLAFALVVLVARGLPALRRTAASRRGALLAGVWLVPYAAFFAFWVPHNLEFWIAQSLVFWLLFAGVPRRASVLAGLALALGTINYAGSVSLLADPDRDLYRARVRPFESEAEERDLVVVGQGWIQKDYAERFTRAEVCALVGISGRVDDPRARREEIQTAIEAARARGGRVFVTGEALVLGPTLRAQIGSEAAASLESTFDPYRRDLERGSGPAGPFYVLGQRSGGPD